MTYQDVAKSDIERSNDMIKEDNAYNHEKQSRHKLLGSHSNFNATNVGAFTMVCEKYRITVCAFSLAQLVRAKGC